MSKAKLPKKGRRKSTAVMKDLYAYEHGAKRSNNPEVGLVDPDNDPDQPKTRWSYDPHLAPELHFDPTTARGRVDALISDALATGDRDAMAAALKELRAMQAPFLQWTGKAEKTSFDVDTVSLHVHEKIDPATVLRGIRSLEAQEAPMQGDLFAQAFQPRPLREAMDFYGHDRGWANRFVLGDSLVMMNSLLRKEGMAGQVQTINFDPPYGIKYGSNFQPFVNKRDVKDRSDEDLTNEPEMIKAFRDTWELGIHSYLAYLRDRLLLARELLADSGSIFVQISDENLHHVRELLDEVFGADNFMGLIAYKKTTSASTKGLASVYDVLVWYAKDRQKAKYRQLYLDKKPGEDGGQQYTWAELPNGARKNFGSSGFPEGVTCRIFRQDNTTSQRPAQGDDVTEFAFQGRLFSPGKGTFKTDSVGLTRLARARRLLGLGNTLSYARFIEDFPVFPLNNFWDDTVTSGFSDKKTYVVQTHPLAFERCVLMTSDPGDLVVDITCGSGTTAYIAEKWGRRWITCDTSRVALTLAKQRLMTATFDYYALKYPEEGVRSGFVYKTVPHIMLSSIANNPDIDEIYERMHPATEVALEALAKATKEKDLKEWEVPFDLPDDWPQSAMAAFNAFHKARRAMQEQMDASIYSHAEQEVLYDQPKVDKSKVRITGPFTVEATPFPSVQILNTAEEPPDASVAVARSGETSRQSQWKDELLKTGIRGKGGAKIEFASLETQPGTKHIQAAGTTVAGDVVAVCFGPEHAPLEQRAVARALEEAATLVPKPKMVIFAAFAFDPEAAKDIEETKWPGVTLLRAEMNTDLLTEDLKKGRATNESFWLVGQPDVEVKADKDGTVRVVVHGFDYFDPRTGELHSGGKSKIALWMLDTDYDGRALYPRQVFFPMAGAKDGWNKLSKDLKALLDEDKLEAFTGTESLPFKPGAEKRAAVKIVDDRGIESLKILPLG
jgi:adenine-specific DNA-methyltransferase